MGSGTRGAATRVRLQAELAQHRGSFLQSIMQSMCIYGPDFKCRPDSGGDAAARDFRGQIPGKIWRLRPHPRPWPAAISGDDDLRFSHGRKHPIGDGRSCPFGGDVRTGKFGWRTNGTSNSIINSIMFARGPTLEHFHAKTAGIDVEGEVLRTTSRSTLGHLCTGFPERNGGHCSEKGGDECRSERVLRNYIRSICSDSQSKAKRSPEAKGKGEGTDKAEEADA